MRDADFRLEPSDSMGRKIERESDVPRKDPKRIK